MSNFSHDLINLASLHKKHRNRSYYSRPWVLVQLDSITLDNGIEISNGDLKARSLLKGDDLACIWAQTVIP